MQAIRLSNGIVHRLPADFKQAITASPTATALWQDITPLARNEWICWITSPKLPATRAKRIPWGIDQMEKGQRRPCCWIGCPHRPKS